MSYPQLHRNINMLLIQVDRKCNISAISCFLGRRNQERITVVDMKNGKLYKHSKKK